MTTPERAANSLAVRPKITAALEPPYVAADAIFVASFVIAYLR